MSDSAVATVKMSDLQSLKHLYEQSAYSEIRSALQEDFLACPELFVANHGCRPEDLNGRQLREFYPHFLVQQREVKSQHEGFRRRFLEGRIF